MCYILLDHVIDRYSTFWIDFSFVSSSLFKILNVQGKINTSSKTYQFCFPKPSNCNSSPSSGPSVLALEQGHSRAGQSTGQRATKHNVICERHGAYVIT